MREWRPYFNPKRGLFKVRKADNIEESPFRRLKGRGTAQILSKQVTNAIKNRDSCASDCGSDAGSHLRTEVQSRMNEMSTS